MRFSYKGSRYRAKYSRSRLCINITCKGAQYQDFFFMAELSFCLVFALQGLGNCAVRFFRIAFAGYRLSFAQILPNTPGVEQISFGFTE